MTSFNHVGTDDENEPEFEFGQFNPPAAVVHQGAIEQGELNIENINSVEDLMSEAERRLAQAQYYETLISGNLFEGDSSPSAIEVSREIQEFARERLSILLGIKTPKPAMTEIFDEEEIGVLKKIVAKLLKRPEIAGIPAPASPKKPAKPTLRQYKKTQRQESTQAPPVQQRAPQARPAPAPVAAPPTKTPIKEVGEVVTIPQRDGTSRKYTKVVDSEGNEMYVGANGQRYAMETNEAGENYMRSLTRQTRPPPNSGGRQPIPPLTSDQMAVVAARHVEIGMKQDPVASGNLTMVTSSS